MLGKVNHKNNFLWLQLQNAKKIYNKKEKLLFPAKVIDDSKTAFLLVRYFALLNSQVTDV